MLGWEIFIERERDAVLLASWLVGHSGLDWVRDLESRGLATPLQKNGYPTKFAIKAKDILPVLTRREVPPHDSKEVLGDDYYLPAKFSRNFRLNEPELERCSPDETIFIEAWDQS